VIVDAPGIVTAAVAVASVSLVGIADSRSGVRARVLDTGRGGLATSDPPEEERGGAHARATAGSARELRLGIDVACSESHRAAEAEVALS